MEFDKEFLGKLFKQAKENPRLRQNLDLRTSSADTSQRMLNALLPGTVVPIHRHEKTTETVICLVGKLEEIIYEEVNEYVHETTSCCDDVTRQKSFKEVSRHILSPAEGRFGIQIPAGAWHTIHVIEPSVIFEAKDGAYIARNLSTGNILDKND
ncbi:WbuC family cupin fold metalloprotein [Bacteroides sp. AN502(2024)]|uniref:WbuC family cupin fold metalloprotein n=1 Tax=Bacteroides sp. AN502(2024) TaxID=3160599 RepID=UPI003510F85E